MVDRTYLQCMSCHAVVACRTQFGHGREQTYLFACPSCGVDLGYSLFIDHENVSWKYDELVNVEGYSGDDEPPHLLNFSSDYLVERKLTGGPDQFPLSPFMSNLALASDREEYLLLRKTRRRAADVLWPGLQRANIHRLRGDFNKFESELKSIDAVKDLASFATAAMPQIIAEGFESFEAIFSSGNDAERKLVAERIAEAVKIDTASVTALKSFYAADDRANRLFEEMRALDRQWVELYPFFEALEILDCLKDPTQSLSDEFTLSEKPLARLKTFHSDCFETVGRLFVIAACYEGISSGRGMGVPSRRRLIPPEEFELMANGTKPDLVARMPFWKMFDGLFDSKLRNGIGHHSWKYDPSSDMISYQNHSQARGRENFTIAYLDFCIRTRKLYHCATFASQYLHSVWV